MAKVNVYEMITNKMIEALSNGIVPWQRPWNVNMAVSHSNGKPYSMLNQFLLDNKGGEWLTFNQIKDAGGSIIKGEKSHFIVFWSFIPKKEKDETTGKTVVVGQFPILKYYNVWHISQCEGITAKYPVVENMEHNTIDECEKIIENYSEREPIVISRSSETNEAYYVPSLDCINAPMLSQYKVTEEYYSTLFHEMTHSTGAKNRLNRDGIVNFDRFGSEQYSKEELVAEMGAAFLCSMTGIDCSKAFPNSVAYIQGWLKKLNDDKKMVVNAASKAEQAVKYILTGEKSSKGE